MGVEFWSTSFAAPEPSLLNLLVELVGNYPPMPLITEKKRFDSIFSSPRAVTPSPSDWIREVFEHLRRPLA